MSRRHGFIGILVLLLLVAGLLLAGCGESDAKGENGNGDPNGNGDVNGGDENGNGGIDLSDPEKVLESFLAAYADLDCQMASPYLTESAQVEFYNWVGELEENPYYYELMKLILEIMSVEITGHDIVGEKAAVYVLVSMPDFGNNDHLTEDQRDALMAVILVLAATGVHPGGEDMGMRPGPEIDLDEAWAVAFSMMPDIVAALPVVTMEDTLYLVNEDGQWKIDEIPDSPV